MLGQNFDDTTALLARVDVPLEVASAMAEDGVELVRHELVGGEDAERARVPAQKQLVSMWPERPPDNATYVWETASRSSPVIFMQL